MFIGEGYILTCAHVVGQCLKIEKKTKDVQVEDVINKDIKIDYGGAQEGQKLTAQGREKLRARILPDFWRMENRDVAVLKVNCKISDTVSTALFVPEYTFGNHEYYALGFPKGHPSGIVSKGTILTHNLDGFVQIEANNPQGRKVEKGFSGSPIWDVTTGGIVGMSVTRDTDEGSGVAFMLPYGSLKELLESVEVISLSDVFRSDPQHQDLINRSWRGVYELLKPEHYMEDPQNLEQALKMLQQVPPKSQESEQILLCQFVAYYCSSRVDLSTKLVDQLRRWIAARSKDVDDLIQSVEQKIENRQREVAEITNPHFLLWIKQEQNSDRYIIDEALLVKDKSKYSSETGAGAEKVKITSGGLTLDEVKQKLIEGLRYIGSNEIDIKKLTVHTFVSLEQGNLDIDRWPAESFDNADPIGSLCCVVIRATERFSESFDQMIGRWRAKWRKTVDELMGNTANHHFVYGDRKESHVVRGELGKDCYMGLMLTQPPPAFSPRDGKHPFSSLMRTGAPIALWPRRHFQEGVCTDEFQQLLSAPLRDLPNLIQQRREEVSNPDHEEGSHICHNIGLIWEDYDLVPRALTEEISFRAPQG